MTSCECRSLPTPPIKLAPVLRSHRLELRPRPRQRPRGRVDLVVVAALPPFPLRGRCRAKGATADGAQHAENPRDETRDAYLARQGWTVLRFWNHEVMRNCEGVLATILARAGLPW